MAPSPPNGLRGRQSAHQDESVGFTMALLSACFLLGGFILSHTIEGRWAFLLYLLAATSLQISLWFLVLKKDLRSFVLKAAFFAEVIRGFFPIGMCLSVPLSEEYLFPWGEYLFAAPFVSALGGALPSLAIAAVLICSKPFTMIRRYDVTYRQLTRRISGRFELFLIIAGCIKLTYWISITVLDNPIFYFARILISTITFVPFFVGYSAFRFKRATLFWLGILAFELAASFITGTRGAAFFPIIYFMLGFVFGLPSWSARMRWGVVLAPMSIFLLAAGVYIGAVRDVAGRTDLKKALSGQSMLEAKDDISVASNIDFTGGVGYKAFRRLTNWAGYAVPSMTPDPVPYRGFEDFIYEVKATFGSLGIFAMINPNFRGNYYFSNIFLKPYGFPVHVSRAGVRSSNAPIPLHIDSFTRGGWLAAFASSCFAYTMIMFLDRLLKAKLLPRQKSLYLFMLIFLCYIAIDRFLTIGFVHCMRQIAFEGVFFFVCFFGVVKVLKLIGKIEVESI